MMMNDNMYMIYVCCNKGIKHIDVTVTYTCIYLRMNFIYMNEYYVRVFEYA